mgnify:CR=1 FL=1
MRSGSMKQLTCTFHDKEVNLRDPSGLLKIRHKISRCPDRAVVRRILEAHKSIDDFGSGYSSLGVFEQIPASVIKLDRSFLLNNENRSQLRYIP